VRSLASIPRSWLLVAAIAFATSLIFYTAVWIVFAGWMPAVQLGIDWKREFGPYLTITHIQPGSPAERSHLQVNDRILSVNGYPQHVMSAAPAIAHGQPGDVVTLRVQRPGVPQTFDVSLTLAPAAPRPSPTIAQRLAIWIINCYPVPFLVVGLLVLFLRLEDRNAWLLALVFAGFICAAPVAFLEGRLPPALMRFMLSYMILLYGILPATFYLFFGTFPTSSPIDQKLPWLKHLLLSIGLVVCVFFALMGLFTGSSYTAVRILHAVGDKPALALSAAYLYIGFGLGMISLLWNALKAPAPNDRRKSRVMLWGTAIGLGPMLVASAIAYTQHKTFYDYSFWFVVTPIVALTLLPLSFAYSVVKYRVLEVPVLLRRSARYFLVQRGFLLLILLAGVAATLILARGLERYLPERNRMAVPAGAALGIFMVWGGTQMESRVTRRLDRAFFRSSYDTRQILLDLASKTRNAPDRQQLSELLRSEIDDALHPSTLALYFRRRGGDFVTADEVPAILKTLPGDLPVLRHMQEHGEPWEIAPTPGDAPALRILQPLQPECLVPIQDRNSRLLGLAVLGPKLSEESYSGEDKRLLDSVANQAGLTLENFDLAENMAERLETERRARQEMDIARQVQSKLLPQKAPVLKTIDYAGACIQARAVGGDYYDFLDLGEGRVGFVLADVAGKGISAALLMANLQAHLRSQSAIVSHDFSQTLEKVNRLFFESTEPNNYATLFIGVYDDATRRLRYVNCGHNPPVIVRGDGVERLYATATVLGLFEQWRCDVDETQISPRDILAICTDGVFEATNPAGVEFGEEGLVAALQSGCSLSAAELLASVIDTVKKFAPGEQADDITLLVAKALT
jgi:sigma-B regulation protein RsbU (phosphoserine phosphatase)